MQTMSFKRALHSSALGAAAVLALCPASLAQTSRITVRGTVISIVGSGDQGGVFDDAVIGHEATLVLTVSEGGIPSPDGSTNYEIRQSSSTLSVGDQMATLSPTLDASYASIANNDFAYGDYLSVFGTLDGAEETAMQMVYIDPQNQQWTSTNLSDLAGLNFGPETPESYFQVYRATGSVNFSIHMIEFDDRVGVQYCGSAVNSTGSRGEMSGYGSTLTGRNNLDVTASSLPPGAIGFFLISQARGFVPQPGGSMGNLCLSGDIGRYVAPGQIRTATPAGTISLNIDFTTIPSPSGPVAGQPGQIWHIQLWHRDNVNGQSTSNLTSGLDFMLE